MHSVLIFYLLKSYFRSCTVCQKSTAILFPPAECECVGGINSILISFDVVSFRKV